MSSKEKKKENKRKETNIAQQPREKKKCAWQQKGRTLLQRECLPGKRNKEKEKS